MCCSISWFWPGLPICRASCAAGVPLACPRAGQTTRGQEWRNPTRTSSPHFSFWGRLQRPPDGFDGVRRAVEAAQRNIGRRENVNIAQADIFQLPFRDETFDFIFSIGVLHHTPSTKAAFDRLPRLLRKDGRIAIWVYTSYSATQWRFSDLYRRFTPRIPKRILHALCYAAVPLYFVYKIPIAGLFFRWILPVSNHPRSEWRVLDTFDWYSPKYQWKHSYEEVFPWFEENGLTSIKVLKVPVGIQGTKP